MLESFLKDLPPQVILWFLIYFILGCYFPMRPWSLSNYVYSGIFYELILIGWFVFAPISWNPAERLLCSAASMCGWLLGSSFGYQFTSYLTSDEGLA